MFSRRTSTGTCTESTNLYRSRSRSRRSSACALRSGPSRSTTCPMHRVATFQYIGVRDQ